MPKTTATTSSAARKTRQQGMSGTSQKLDGTPTPKKGKQDQETGNSSATLSGHPIADPSDDNVSFKSIHTTKSKAKSVAASKKSVSSTESTRRLRELEAQLKALKDIEKLEEDARQKQKEIIRAELELSKARFDAEAESTSQDDLDEDDSYLRDIIDQLPQCPSKSKADSVKDWIFAMPAQPDNPTPIPVPQNLPQPSSSSSIETMNNRIEKLLARQTIPKDLPSFHGEPDEWASFYMQYSQSTDACGLTNQENMMRLLKSLGGKAREAVLPMLAVPDNVPVVMDTLQKMFGRPNLIIKTMTNKLRNLPPAREHKPDSIIAFANAIQNLVSTMKNLNCHAHLNNPTLLDDLVSKLSPTLQLQWFATNDVNGDIEMLSRWMSTMASAACLMSTSGPTHTDTRNNYPPSDRHFKKPVLLASSSKPRPKVPAHCLRCTSAEHKLPECPKFKTDGLDKRWELVSRNKLCFSCLTAAHQVTNCPHKKQCGIGSCTKPHHVLLHKPQESTFVGHAKLSACMKDVLLKVIPVVLTGPKGELHTYALLDEGSEITMIEADAAKSLGLEGQRQPLCIEWTKGVVQSEPDSKSVAVTVSSINMGAREFTLRNVQTVKSMSLPSQSINMADMKKHWPYLKDIPFPSLLNAQPVLLIGEDNALLCAGRNIIHGKWNEPIATKTWLGWVIHGSAMLPKETNSRVLVHHVCHDENSNDNELNNLVKQYFSVENYGIQMSTDKLMTKEEERGESILNATTKRIGNRFETGLLWRADNVNFPVSKSTAMQRLHCMERKMDKDPNFAALYIEKIADYVNKGYAYKLSPQEAAITKPQTYYLPHFSVTNVNKPGKIRTVFDAAAKSQGVSLNSMLIKGPKLLNDLPAILWRFRRNCIGFTADIAEMFLQVQIRQEDRDSQRFLWRGERRQGPPDEYVMRSMTFGATCSPSAAIFVLQKNAEEFQADYPHIFDAVKKSFYMDDYIDSINDEQKAIQQIQDMIEIQKRGGFKLCNWICNNKNVLESIPTDMRAKAWKELQPEAELPTERVLGLWWNPEEDHFTFKFNMNKVNPDFLDGSSKPTKRDILKISASVYDPLGFVSNFTIKARILFQSIWQTGIQWDDEIPGAMQPTWLTWCRDLTEIHTVRVPRCYLPGGVSASPDLHVFCDASQHAYSCVAYLRWELDNIHVSFVAARARVAPLKPLTIPRLELMAALIASKLASTIMSEIDIKINSAVFWSDSRVVLSWIHSDAAKYKQFVANRLGEIQDLTDPSNWFWVSTNDNVADDATRLGADTSFDPSHRWYRGPDFLWTPQASWPPQPQNASVIVPDEIRAAFVGVNRPVQFNCLPDPTRFSSYKKLIAATAWAFRFIRNLRCKPADKSPTLSVFELQEAERKWRLQVQQECFYEEVRNLLNRHPISPNSKLASFLAYLDEENILRVHSRVQYSDLLPDAAKFPIILDSKHPFTKLLIHDYHERACHQGIETVINNLREKYWLTSMRSAVKNCFHNCQLCKVLKTMPKPQLMAPLPSLRVNSDFKIFDNIGMDYFGPLYVTVNRHVEKRYVVLFTCLTVRAIHLEVAHSLTTDSAIMAIQRFCNRRTMPSNIYSDNGKNLRGAANEIKKDLKSLDQDKIKKNLAKKNVNWHFLPPSAPFMAGAWERLVRSVKTAMTAALSMKKPQDEVLLTFLTEVENVINSRPITHVSSDPGDLKSLSPNDFLKFTAPAPGALPLKSDSSSLRKLWRQSQKMADMFWSRWVKEYLPSLSVYPKWRQINRDVQVGDIVLIADGNTPRGSWPLGRVSQIYPGKDQRIRVVDVKTSTGTYRRPVAKLAVLEVNKDEEQ